MKGGRRTEQEFGLGSGPTDPLPSISWRLWQRIQIYTIDGKILYRNLHDTVNRVVLKVDCYMNRFRPRLAVR